MNSNVHLKNQLKQEATTVSYKMELHLNKIKNALTPKQTRMALNNAFFDPELGFKVLYNRNLQEIKVIIIAARHLPMMFGLSRVDGYILKVKMFPGKEKFETSYKKESWPTYHEEFSFKLNPSESNDKKDPLNGKFIVLVGYAILEQKSTQQASSISPISSPTKKEKLLKMFNGESFMKMLDIKNAPKEDKTYKDVNTLTFEKRRTIGSITYVIDYKKFIKECSHNWVSTEEMWKNLQDISNGIGAQVSKKNEYKKGEAEVGLLYNKSEDGESCTYELSIVRMHCNMQVMQKHEEFNGYLYIKLRILKENEVVNKGKTEKFEPSISHKFDINSTRLKSKFTITDIENVSFQVALLVKTKAGQKDVLGSIYMSSKCKGPYLTQWEESITSPGKKILKWQYFE